MYSKCVNGELEHFEGCCGKEITLLYDQYNAWCECNICNTHMDCETCNWKKEDGSPINLPDIKTIRKP